VRWSGPETESYLRLALARSAYKVRFRVLRSVTADVLDSLRFEANGRAIPLTKRRADVWGGVTVEGTIPADVIGDAPVEFAFKVNKTVQLSEINDNIRKFRRLTRRQQDDEPDTRLGGLLYNWLEITANKK
jgi:hypothetical protein